MFKCVTTAVHEEELCFLQIVPKKVASLLKAQESRARAFVSQRFLHTSTEFGGGAHLLRRYQDALDLGNLPSPSLFEGVSCLGKIDRTYLLHNATRSAPPRLRGEDVGRRREETPGLPPPPQSDARRRCCSGRSVSRDAQSPPGPTASPPPEPCRRLHSLGRASRAAAASFYASVSPTPPRPPCPSPPPPGCGLRLGDPAAASPPRPGLFCKPPAPISPAPAAPAHGGPRRPGLLSSSGGPRARQASRSPGPRRLDSPACLPARGQCGAAAAAAAKHGAGTSAPAGEADGEQRPPDTHLRGAAAAGARRAGRRGGRRGRGGANGAAAPPPTAAQPSPAGLRGALGRRLRARRAPRLGRGRRRRRGRLRPARGPAGRRTRTRSCSDACRGAARSPAKQTMRRALRPARCVRDAPRPPPP